MIGTGLTFAAIVGVAGTIVGLLLGALSWDDLRMVAKLAVIAFLVGALYSGVLAIAARGRTFDRLSLRFVTALGAGGGLLYFLFIAAANGARVWSVWNAIGNLAILTLLGGGSAAATLIVARRAGRALNAGVDSHSLGEGSSEAPVAPRVPERPGVGSHRIFEATPRLNESPDGVPAGRLDQIRGERHVAGDQLRGVRFAGRDPVRGQMADRSDPSCSQDSIQFRRGKVVDLRNVEPRAAGESRAVRRRTTDQSCDAMAVRKQPPRQRGADEPRYSRDEDGGLGRSDHRGDSPGRSSVKSWTMKYSGNGRSGCVKVSPWQRNSIRWLPGGSSKTRSISTPA